MKMFQGDVPRYVYLDECLKLLYVWFAFDFPDT